MGEIKSLDELSSIIEHLKQEGKKIVLCHGAFDLLHIGHIRHLEAAKREGNVLVVSITADAFIKKGPGRPMFNQDLRSEAVASLSSVDYVTISHEASAVEAITKIKPDVYVKGSEYRDRKPEPGQKFPREKETVESFGGRVHFTDEITFSSTEVINRDFSPYSEEARKFLDVFRRKYSAEDIISLVKELRTLKVLVVGDTIIDEYHYCTPEGTSPKRRVVVSRYLREERFTGGAVITARHLAGFLKEVTLVTTFAPQDEEFIRPQLEPSIRLVRLESGAPTVVKRRFLDESGQALFAVSYLDEPRMQHHEELTGLLAREAPNYDVVIVNDFGHGLLEGESLRVLEKAKFLSINAQTNSLNMGFNLVSRKYRRADYICQDELEMRLASHDRDGALDGIIKSIAKAMMAKVVAVTMGAKGSYLYSDAVMSHIPALTKKVIESMGVGDAYLAITAPCAAMGYPTDVIGFIGNAMAALKGQIIGNKPVDPVSLFKFIQTLLRR